jgi:hypothetical protein
MSPVREPSRPQVVDRYPRYEPTTTDDADAVGDQVAEPQPPTDDGYDTETSKSRDAPPDSMSEEEMPSVVVPQSDDRKLYVGPPREHIALKRFGEFEQFLKLV